MTCYISIPPPLPCPSCESLEDRTDSYSSLNSPGLLVGTLFVNTWCHSNRPHRSNIWVTVFESGINLNHNMEDLLATESSSINQTGQCMNPLSLLEQQRGIINKQINKRRITLNTFLFVDTWVLPEFVLVDLVYLLKTNPSRQSFFFFFAVSPVHVCACTRMYVPVHTLHIYPHWPQVTSKSRNKRTVEAEVICWSPGIQFLTNQMFAWIPAFSVSST